MSLIKSLTKRPEIRSEKKDIIGIAFSVVFIAALTVFLAMVLNTGILRPAAAAAVIIAALIRYKLYRAFFQNPPAIHITCLCLGISASGYFSQAAALLNEYDTSQNIILVRISAFIIFFGLSEYIAGPVSSRFGDEPSPELFAKDLLTCAPLYFTVFLFLNSETFFINCGELYYSYMDFAPHYLFKTIVYSLLTSLTLCSFSRKINRFAADIFIGLMICVYSQYMFMNNILPTTVDDAVDWGSLGTDMIINAVIWVVLLVLPLTADIITGKIKKNELSDRSFTLRMAVPAFLGAIQLISLFIMIISNQSDLYTSSFYTLSNREQFVVSPNKNIITFIIDEADQKYFEKAYSDDPELFSGLHDFTYYTNTAMEYDSTVLSIPGMLTAARTYPGDFLDSWYNDIANDEPAQEFYSRLRDNNYSVNVFGCFRFRSNYESFKDLFDNMEPLTKKDLSINKLQYYGEIDNMSAYRFLPLFMKMLPDPSIDLGNAGIIINDSCIHDNIEFYDNTHLTLRSDSMNCFIVQHLVGTHGFSKTLEGNPKTTEEEVIDCLLLLDRYITQLKELGVYDDSLIIITADHGTHSSPDNMPIWYMKRPHETRESIGYCASPISLTDFAATCLDEMGLSKEGDRELFGRPISEIPEDEQRQRLVFQRYDLEGAQLPVKINMSSHDDKLLLGYYYTGTKEDLAEHEKNDPPDIVINTEWYG